MLAVVEADGHLVVLYMTSGGWQAGLANDPRIWRTARWTGDELDVQGAIRSDNNHDMGSLYIEPNGKRRLIVPTQPGPQPFNPVSPSSNRFTARRLDSPQGRIHHTQG